MGRLCQVARFNFRAWKPTGSRSRSYRNFRTGKEISRRQYLNRRRGVTVEKYRTIRAVKELSQSTPNRVKAAAMDYARVHNMTVEEAIQTGAFGQTLRDLQSKDKKRVARALKRLKRPTTGDTGEWIIQYYLTADAGSDRPS